jgi:hypothetical protein
MFAAGGPTFWTAVIRAVESRSGAALTAIWTSSSRIGRGELVLGTVRPSEQDVAPEDRTNQIGQSLL